jgi:hypothetical protein
MLSIELCLFNLSIDKYFLKINQYYLPRCWEKTWLLPPYKLVPAMSAIAWHCRLDVVEVRDHICLWAEIASICTGVEAKTLNACLFFYLRASSCPII